MTDKPAKAAELPWQEQEAAELRAELHLMKTAGIIEVAVRNPNVAEYMAHWEGRALAAEARAQAAEQRVKEAVEVVSEHIQWFERFICDEDELNSSTPRKVARNAQDAATYLRAFIKEAGE